MILPVSQNNLKQLSNPTGPCPVCDLNLETTAPFFKPALRSIPYGTWPSPTVVTVIVTTAIMPREREISPNWTQSNGKWFLDRLWEVGIPHIVFTGGEPTLRPDLPELIAHAEMNGQITGINTNGRLLRNESFVDELVSAGLDHIQINTRVA